MSGLFSFDAASPAEREIVMRAIVESIIYMDEDDAHNLLNVVTAEQTVPDGWSFLSVPARRAVMLRQLRREEPSVLSELTEALSLDIQYSRRTDPDSGHVHTATTTAGHERTITPHAEQDYEASDAHQPIFVVHGHDHATLHYVVRVLERTTGLDVVVLHEQANAGKTILEKFEHHGAAAAFAVILLTGDDEGRAKGDGELQPRARQNVVLELGFFFGKLGRERVVVLAEPDVERPSDIDGLVYIALDPAKTWRTELGRELEAASITVNYSRMP